MSEQIGEARVRILPDASGFVADLDRQMAAQSPRVQAMLQRTGLGGALRESAALRSQAKATGQEVAASNEIIASSARGAGLRYAGLAAAAFVGYSAMSRASAALEVTGQAAGTTEGKLRNLGASLLKGDIVGGFVALTHEATATTQALNDLQAQAAKGDYSGLKALAQIADFIGSKGLRAQVTAASFQVRASRIGDAATAASLTPGLRDDLESAKRAEREAQIGLRVFQQGTAEYSKAFAGYAAAIKARRQVQQAIAKQSVPADETRDARFQLNLLRAKQTTSTANDRAIVAGRKEYLTNQIRGLEEQGANTAAAKTRLTTLYGQLESVNGQLVDLDKQAQDALAAKVAERFAIASTTIQIQAANARGDAQEIAALQADAALNRRTATQKGLDKQAQLGYLLQAAQDDKQIFGIREAAAAAAKAAAEAAAREAEQRKKQLEAERKAAAEKAAAARAVIRQTGELRLQNAIASAALTKGTADDKRAIGVAINYYKNLVRTTRGLQQEQARATVIGLRGQLKGVGTGNEAPRSSASDFFKEAASQFRSFGSNISTAGGILSGQDARGAFAARALSSGNIQMAVQQQAQQTRTNLLTESQKQTTLLTTIAGRLTYGGAERDPPAKGIAKARRGAHVVQAAI